MEKTDWELSINRRNCRRIQNEVQEDMLREVTVKKKSVNLCKNLQKLKFYGFKYGNNEHGTETKDT